jgi:hypothetical protein
VNLVTLVINIKIILIFSSIFINIYFIDLTQISYINFRLF